MQSLQHTFAQEGQLPRGMTVYSRFTMHIALCTLQYAYCTIHTALCTMQIAK